MAACPPGSGCHEAAPIHPGAHTWEREDSPCQPPRACSSVCEMGCEGVSVVSLAPETHASVMPCREAWAAVPGSSPAALPAPNPEGNLGGRASPGGFPHSGPAVDIHLAQKARAGFVCGAVGPGAIWGAL